MTGGGRWAHRRFDRTEIRRTVRKVEFRQKDLDRIVIAFKNEAHHSAEPTRHLSFRDLMLRMCFQAGVEHSSDRGVLLEELRDLQRIRILALHADLKSL